MNANQLVHILMSRLAVIRKSREKKKLRRKYAGINNPKPQEFDEIMQLDQLDLSSPCVFRDVLSFKGEPIKKDEIVRIRKGQNYDSMIHKLISSNVHHKYKDWYATHNYNASNYKDCSLQLNKKGFPVAGATPRTWVGYEDVGVHFHRDWTNSILIQVLGVKKVKLIEPFKHDTILRYRKIHHYVDALEFDYDFIWSSEFADLLNNMSIVVHDLSLSENDVLIIPQGWWHSTRNHTYGVSYNFNF